MASTAEQASPLDTTYAPSGCRPLPMSSREIGPYEGRYEYWDGATELARGARDVSARHEEPCGRLVELVKDIGKMRGRPISLYGTADLQERKRDGTRVQAARADQLIYVDCPAAPPRVIVVGDYPLPGVVFEVDRTTDVRGSEACGVRLVGGSRAVGRGSRREHAEQAQAAGRCPSTS